MILFPFSIKSTLLTRTWQSNQGVKLPNLFHPQAIKSTATIFPKLRATYIGACPVSVINLKKDINVIWSINLVIVYNCV